MASGPTLPIPGGTDMVTVEQGDLILPADFNDARTNLNDMLSAPTAVSDLHGLNQGGVSVGQAVTGIPIEALGSAGAFTELQNDIQALNAFYQATTNVFIQTDIVPGQLIETDEWNGMMYDTKARWDNEEKSYISSTKTNPVSDTWVIANDGVWTGTLTYTATFTWSSAAELNAWFNGGGAVGVEGAIINYTGGDPQTEAWETKLNNLGDVFLIKQDNVAGAGTSTGNGQTDMTTTYKNLNVYAGGSGAPYTNDWANVDAVVNNTTTPTSVTVRMKLRDGADGGTDDPVEGDTRMRGVLFTPNPNGSGFTFTSPTVTQTTITES
jgi:hypothetical protein